jgi:GT2 family glycosyltransferase
MDVIMRGLLEETDYPDLEIMIVDNDSHEPATLEAFRRWQQDPRVTRLPFHGPFNFSGINNRGAEAATGAIVGLINNDMEVIHRDWLIELVSQVCRPGVGVSGALLYYPNGTIQHAGVLLGIGGVAGHAHITWPRGTPGYFGRAELVQRLSCVTAGCMLVHRDLYLRLGGLDEVNLKIAFNDVDFCIRVKEAGYGVVWTPYAELFHHESASRGSDMAPDKAARFRAEAEFMREKWAPVLDNDPAYNPNLILLGSPFEIARISRAYRPWAAQG